MMRRTIISLLVLALTVALGGLFHLQSQSQTTPSVAPNPIQVVLANARANSVQSVALINGRWFSGKSFEPRTLYSVNGRFTSRKPARIDRTLDLSGTWIVPPFAEAHNHNITGIEERDRKALQKYLSDGVFYVKIQGNLPLSDELRRRLPMNRPDGPDVVLASDSHRRAPDCFGRECPHGARILSG